MRARYIVEGNVWSSSRIMERPNHPRDIDAVLPHRVSALVRESKFQWRPWLSTCYSSEVSFFLKTPMRLYRTVYALNVIQIKSGTRRILEALQGIPSTSFTRKLASRRLIGPRASRLSFAALHVAALLCLTLAPLQRQRRLADHDTDRLPSCCYSQTHIFTTTLPREPTLSTIHNSPPRQTLAKL